LKLQVAQNIGTWLPNSTASHAKILIWIIEPTVDGILLVTFFYIKQQDDTH